MKFLLAAVNAKYIHSNPAVYSLKAYAGEEYEKEIEIAEYTINNSQSYILSDLYKRRPDAVAFSCYIWNWRIVRELSEELSKIMPGLPIWMGGPEVSFDAEEILKECGWITGIMTGEGEETFRELFCLCRRALADGGTIGGNSGKTEGLVCRQGGKIVRTGQREPLDMNSLPFLYHQPEKFRNRIIYYESSRGCPYRCSYCLSSVERKVRFRNIETVKKELQFLLDAKVAQVKFVDRTFNCFPAHAMEIWKYIDAHDNGITNFHFEIAADRMNEEELTILSQMRPGLVQLEIGIQSANLLTLREIDREADMEKLERIVGRIRGGGNVHVHLDLIAGLPYEDYASFGRSFDTVYAMRPEQLQLGFLKVLKGSPMHERAEKYGIKYTSLPPYEVLCTDWLSYGEICRLKQIEEMVELYYNSNQFTHTLPVLEKSFSSPFSMFEKLAEYYEENGYFLNSPSRAYRYDILLKFALRCGREEETLYKELLTYDIYLRENMKSRPGFARDLSGYKEEFRNFYSGEEGRWEVLSAYRGCQAREMARMTHMELFHYPVWKTGGSMDKLNEEKKVVFDYGERNPLTKEARTITLD